MPQTIHIDLAAMASAMSGGILRAAAFPQTVLKLLEAGVPASIAPSALLQWRFFPEPLSDQMRAEISQELPHWAVSTALKDLDQSFSILMDGLWDAVQVGRIAAGEIDKSALLKSISDQTNSARKHRKVFKAAGKLVGQISDDNKYLATLSEARNCLAHNLGIVDERRAPDGVFTLRWLSLSVAGHGADGSIYKIEEMTTDWIAPTETTVVVTVELIERHFSLNERVILDIHDLLQICFLYQIMTQRSISAAEDYLRESGIPVSEPGAPLTPFRL